MSKYILYHDSSSEPLDVPANKGLSDALLLARNLLRHGAPIELVETAKLDAQGIYQCYLHAVTASVLRKYRIRQVFGSRRRSGWLFGRGVPALVVYASDKDFPEDVYPHDSPGGVTTIQDFLESSSGNVK